MTDEKLLLDLLNTTPVLDGTPRDELADAELGREWLAAHGQPTSAQEWRALVDVRSALQDVVRGDAEPEALAPFVDGVSYRAVFDDGGIKWDLDTASGRAAASRAVLAWDTLRHASPGRLRPCANPECRRFLIDHSKPNTARWCSMAVCGNRMKARRHYQRTRQAGA
ncbi:CGNR zinc finger domain-containing protein [Amycolatopsis carbonis]|uniref:CGNR zinc finger domain-containing protein n=1 Tax=Amycolatopsis carbonis TaxID=715471 RepID=A0A9Y2IMP4_9PSEU|nr:CGNR zinc finger domain-containing protein [Amycolatopsis sp. 2-15]WIX82739.1 CGNR zinc finger domain-containing protein [Amycolatopsis sp. 2-15]